MKKMSLKLKLTFLLAAIVLTVVGVICLLNSIFFEKYYIKDREKKLVNSYNEMKEVLVSDGISSDSVRKKMLSINALHNINVFLVDSNWKTVYSTQNNIENTYRWLQHFIFSGDRDIELIKENDNYSIKKGNDISTGLSYMVIYGSMEDGSQLVMQLIIESIKENIKIFNNFVTITGAVVMVISIIFAYFLADKFTKPIKELSKIAEEMSELNFDAKYTGKAQNEIGQLGKSINFMSDSLQKNITMLKTANYELQLDIEEKTKAADRQKEFLSNVSHELKTPIALIQGYAEGLKEGVASDKESFDFYCDVIMDESNKMNRMVKNLLSLDHIESGQNNINIERFNLTELINEICKANELRLDQKNIVCVSKCQNDIYVWYDKLQIEEVFTNFYTNAINHSTGKIKISLKKTDGKAKLEVYNSGNKIPENDLTRIWEKFYKVDKARTREYGGNGLGLSIVKAILDNYDVEYGVDNVDDGVVFWCVFDCD